MSSMDWSLPEWFIPEPREEEESIDLDDEEKPAHYTDQDREQAVQDWWDAWRNAGKGEEDWEEAERAQEWFEQVFGDDFAETWDRIVHKLDEIKNPENMQDIPADWYMTLTAPEAGSGSGAAGGGTIGGAMERLQESTEKMSSAAGSTEKAAKNMQTLPGEIKTAIEDAMRNVTIYLDGDAITSRVATDLGALVDVE